MLMKTSKDLVNVPLLSHMQLAFWRSKCRAKHLNLGTLIQPSMFIEHLPCTRNYSKFSGFITIDTENPALVELTF